MTPPTAPQETPRPWTVIKANASRAGDRGPDVAILGPTDELIAEVFNRVRDFSFADNEANAALICRSVNAFYALVGALEAARHSLVTLHGLTATDEPLLPSLDRWTIDESKTLAVIDTALQLARGKPAAEPGDGES